MKIKLYILFICALFSKAIIAQTDWHVATNGVDANGNGTLANPFATITYASTKTNPGDTVLVHAGTYHTSDFNDGDIWTGSNLVTITANGLAGNYITFKPYQNDVVVLEFDGTYGVIIRNASYINFEGFTVKGISDQLTKTEADAAWGLYIDDSDGLIYDLKDELGITDINNPALIGTDISKAANTNITKPVHFSSRGIVANQSHHINITSNIVKDVPSSAIRAQKSDYITISYNKVFRNTYWTTQGVGAITVAEAAVRPSVDTFTGVKIILEKNEVYDNENRMISWAPSKDFVHFAIDEGSGLFLTRNQNTYTHGYIQISNNLAYNNGANGIINHQTDRTIIEHNTVYNNGANNTGLAGGISINRSDDVTIRNNISYGRGDKWALGISANPVTNLVVLDNVIFNNNGTENVTRNIPDDGGAAWVEVDPLFVDAANYNLRLQAGSVGIDNGNTATLQTDDIVDFLRSDGMPDIGAYEYNVALSVDDFESAKMTVYPNPFTDFIFINQQEEIREIALFTITGQQINIGSLENKRLDLSRLSKGIYILRVDNKLIKIIKN